MRILAKKSLFIITVFVLGLMVLQSCTVHKNAILWVSGTKSECTGVVEMQCLNVHRGEDIENPNWEYFYAEIEGFKFEEGVSKKIEVKEEHLKNVPADASSIKYTFVKELERKVDQKSGVIDGKWILNRLKGNPIEGGINVPDLEIRPDQMQVGGTGGCNNYFGPLKKLTSDLIQFGNIASTKMACADKNIEQEYFEALNSVESYQLDGKTLTFFQSQEEVLSFLRED